MAITLDLTTIKASNHTLIRTEVDRLRTKLGLSAYSWTALGGTFATAADWNNTRAGVAAFNGAQYVGTLDLTSVPTKTALENPITTSEYTGAVNVLATVDAVCVNNANYSNCAYYSANNSTDYASHYYIYTSDGSFSPHWALD